MSARWLVGVGLALGLGVAAASAQGLGTEAIRAPVDVAGPEWLDALVMTPGTPGRHPLALLISYGSPRWAADRLGRARPMQGGGPIWEPIVEAFLQAHDLPTAAAGRRRRT